MRSSSCSAAPRRGLRVARGARRAVRGDRRVLLPARGLVHVLRGARRPTPLVGRAPTCESSSAPTGSVCSRSACSRGSCSIFARACSAAEPLVVESHPISPAADSALPRGNARCERTGKSSFPPCSWRSPRRLRRERITRSRRRTSRIARYDRRQATPVHVPQPAFVRARRGARRRRRDAPLGGRVGRRGRLAGPGRHEPDAARRRRCDDHGNPGRDPDDSPHADAATCAATPTASSGAGSPAKPSTRAERQLRIAFSHFVCGAAALAVLLS